jgi:L-fuconolactonase
MMLDSHQHFWRYNAEDYGWIDESMVVIRQDFLPADLAPTLEASGFERAIAVQARQTAGETAWLLELAAAHEIVAGVVGWVPLREESVGDILDEWASRPEFCGVRHVLQDEPAAFFHDEAFHRGLHEVARRGLTYDLLINQDQFLEALMLVDRHPSLRIVLDHLGKPVADGPPPAAWLRGLREFAARPNVWCKISGLVTEAPGRNWTTSEVRPYFDAALQAFGPHRLMFGSDWPVCLVVVPHGDWTAMVRDCAAPFSAAEAAALFGGTASAFYLQRS